MRHRVPLLSTLASSALVACTMLREEAPIQESAHRAGEPTSATYEWLWANETFEELKANATAYAFKKDEDYFPLDHPVAMRLQAWIDAMDAAVRHAHPESTKNIPTPRVVLLKEGLPNAWVTRIPVRWNVAARRDVPLDAGETDGGIPVAETLSLDAEGRVMETLSPTFERAVDANKLTELVKFANSGYAHCRLGTTGGALTFNEACAPGRNPVVSEGKTFAYGATAKHVSVTSSYLFAIDREEWVVSILAHELGHFYRSHVNMPTDVTNYFYSLEGGNGATKPPPDPRYLAHTEKAREKLRTAPWDFDDENRLMVEQNLGFYTVEQEADELGLELASFVGIEPSSAIEQALAFQRYVENEFGVFDPGTVRSAECAQLRERGFKDDAGRWVSVPVGSLWDAHHSGCFRAFNIQREIEAHRYAAGSRPPIPGRDWSALLAELRTELGVAPPDAGLPRP